MSAHDPQRRGQSSSPGFLDRVPPGWRVGGLGLRVVAFLSLALLPIGIIAMLQTSDFQREALRRSELSLLALTERAASVERQAIERAFGAADAMSLVIDLFDDPATCSQYLQDFLSETDQYTFIGLIPPDGIMTCSSMGGTVDTTGWTGYADRMETPRRVVSLNSSEAESWVVIISSPVYRNEIFAGYMTISIPHDAISADQNTFAPDKPLSLVTYNAEGVILTAQGDQASIADNMPQGISLAANARDLSYAFTAQDRSGQQRVFAITPIVNGTVYAMGIWDPPEEFRSFMGTPFTPGLFPIVMWLASLIVAYYAIHRLVIRPVRELGSNMRRFASDRHVPKRLSSRDTPVELRDIEEDFMQMAAGILQDEAQLEDTVRERGILLKEVHHRVRNNLQLISSIMSMQMRRTKDDTTRAILGRLQDRILGLATIHRSLYQSNDMGRVNAAQLVREIVEQQAIAKHAGDDVVVTLDLDEIELLPDQAVPLSLLVAEAVANAMNNIGDPVDGPPWITVALELGDEDTGIQAGRIEIANSMTAKADPPEETADPPEAVRRTTARPTRRNGLGLGMNLIQAFAAQLGGQCEIATEGGAYRVATTFDVRKTQPDALDY